MGSRFSIWTALFLDWTFIHRALWVLWHTWPKPQLFDTVPLPPQFSLAAMYRKIWRYQHGCLHASVRVTLRILYSSARSTKCPHWSSESSTWAKYGVEEDVEDVDDRLRCCRDPPPKASKSYDPLLDWVADDKPLLSWDDIPDRTKELLRRRVPLLDWECRFIRIAGMVGAISFVVFSIAWQKKKMKRLCLCCSMRICVSIARNWRVKKLWFDLSVFERQTSVWICIRKFW